MGFVVLALGVLMVVAGAYQMVTGSGDILSERGWSAYIAGSVLVGSGAVTAALGLTLRALDQLRRAGGSLVAAPAGAAASRLEPAAATTMPLDLAIEPATHPGLAAPAGLALAEVASHRHEPVPAPDHPEPAVERFATIDHPAETAPPELEAHAVHAPEDAAAPHVDSTDAAAPAAHDDWFDENFAGLEREIAGHHPAAPHETQPEREAETLPVEDHRPEPHDFAPPAAPDYEPEPDLHAPEPHGEAHAEPAHHDEPVPAHAQEAAAPEGAVVSAREAPAAPASQVIGRYESEGTSYVMYADGSIDAQSEAGVYRFASMAELKAFIES